MNENDTPPPGPAPSPRPAYPERKQPRRRTEEISLEEIQRHVRDQLASAPSSSPWKVIGIIAGLLLPSGGVGFMTYRHSDEDDAVQRQMREQARELRDLRDKVQQAQIDVARCCR